MINLQKNCCITDVFFLISFAAVTAKTIKVYLTGDSAMAIKEVKTYPETGWEMPFTNLFDETVSVDNLLQNGRGTKSFIAENRWQPVVHALKEGYLKTCN